MKFSMTDQERYNKLTIKIIQLSDTIEQMEEFEEKYTISEQFKKAKQELESILCQLLEDKRALGVKLYPPKESKFIKQISFTSTIEFLTNYLEKTKELTDNIKETLDVVGGTETLRNLYAELSVTPLNITKEIQVLKDKYQTTF